MQWPSGVGRHPVPFAHSLGMYLFFAMAVFLFIEQFVETHWIVVADNSLCQGAISKLSKTGSVTYQAVMMLVAVWFLLWFGLRAVHMEKTGLLFCFFVVVSLQVWRCMYFSYGGSLREYYPTHSGASYGNNVNQYQGHMRDPDVNSNASKRLAVQVILTIGCALLVIAILPIVGVGGTYERVTAVVSSPSWKVIPASIPPLNWMRSSRSLRLRRCFLVTE